MLGWILVAVIVLLLMFCFALVVGWVIRSGQEPMQIEIDRAGYAEFEQWKAERAAAQQNMEAAGTTKQEVQMMMRMLDGTWDRGPDRRTFQFPIDGEENRRIGERRNA